MIDTPEHNEIRAKLEDKANFEKLIDEIPNSMDLEKLAISEMIKSGDVFQAIRALPLSMRRFLCSSVSIRYFQQNS